MSDPNKPSDTPILRRPRVLRHTDAFRKAMKDPIQAKAFADAGNAIAAVLRLRDEKPTPEDDGLIEFPDFLRVDIRVGTITEAERVAKSDKLLRLMVDIGEGSPRQVVSGIAQSFEPTALVGKQVAVVTNLKPRKMMGLESRGMILAAGTKDDLALLQPTKERAPGSKVS